MALAGLITPDGGATSSPMKQAEGSPRVRGRPGWPQPARCRFEPGRWLHEKQRNGEEREKKWVGKWKEKMTDGIFIYIFTLLGGTLLVFLVK